MPTWADICPEPRSLRRFLLLDLADVDRPAVMATMVFAAYGAFNIGPLFTTVYYFFTTSYYISPHFTTVYYMFTTFYYLLLLFY